MYGTATARVKKPPIRYGDQRSHGWMWKGANYACVRRQEATAALAVAGVHRVEFLSGYSNRDLFRDQRLFC